MKKKGKLILLSVTLILSLTLGTLALMYYVLQVPVFDRSGWVQTQTGVQYLDYYGKPLTGWQQVEGERRYFHPSGELATGLTELEGQQYLLSDGGTLQTGWAECAGDTYYLNPDGTVYTGIWEQDGKRYYMAPDGRRNTSDLWLPAEDKLYYLTADGSILSGWLDTDEGRYYLDETGCAVTGWLRTDLACYYLDSQSGKMHTGFVEIGGTQRYFLPTGEYVPLVNPWIPVTEDFAPRLTEFEEFQVDAACRDALQKMLSQCREAGYECHINSAYRDVQKQQQLWDERYEEYIQDGKTETEAKELTSKRVAVPGTSEHHLGLAVDLGGSSGVYDWLEANCWQYGFIRRYPDNKTEVTGIVYEPWHYRYVGQSLAKAISESGLTLEEYLDTLA